MTNKDEDKSLERLADISPPAASDLRERAEQVVDDWIGDGTGWIDTELKELQDIIYEQFAAIRAEAKVEPTWDDAVKALRASNWPVAGFYADWLAANRPTGREG